MKEYEGTGARPPQPFARLDVCDNERVGIAVDRVGMAGRAKFKLELECLIPVGDVGDENGRLIGSGQLVRVNRGAG